MTAKTRKSWWLLRWQSLRFDYTVAKSASHKPAGQVLHPAESITLFLVFCPFSRHLANCCRGFFSRMEKHIFFHWDRKTGASFHNCYTIKMVFQTMQCHLPNFQSLPLAEELRKQFWGPTNEFLLHLEINLRAMLSDKPKV